MFEMFLCNAHLSPNGGPFFKSYQNGQLCEIATVAADIVDVSTWIQAYHASISQLMFFIGPCLEARETLKLTATLVEFSELKFKAVPRN